MFNTHWNIKKIAIFNLAAIILLSSWLLSSTRTLWNVLDNIVLDVFNTSLAHHELYAIVSAIANMRPIDVAVGLILVGLLIKRDFIVKASQLRQAFFAFFVLLILLLLVRFGFNAILKAFEWKRASPSLVLPNAVRLTQLFPDWKANFYLKDSSEQCFPGDHASVLLIWAMLCSSFVTGRKVTIIWTLTLFFMLPRLIAGAHWASDDFVGGVFLALIAFSWGFYSPILENASNFLTRVFAPILNAIGKLPLLKHLSILKTS